MWQYMYVRFMLRASLDKIGHSLRNKPNLRIVYASLILLPVHFLKTFIPFPFTRQNSLQFITKHKSYNSVVLTILWGLVLRSMLDYVSNQGTLLFICKAKLNARAN